MGVEGGSKVDARLRDAVLGEVLQRGSSIRLSDVAGLVSAKQVPPASAWEVLTINGASAWCCDPCPTPCQGVRLPADCDCTTGNRLNQLCSKAEPNFHVRAYHPRRCRRWSFCRRCGRTCSAG